MKFYKKQHQYYCGIDLHTRTMYLCILDQEGADLFLGRRRDSSSCCRLIYSGKKKVLSTGYGTSISVWCRHVSHQHLETESEHQQPYRSSLILSGIKIRFQDQFALDKMGPYKCYVY